MKYFRTKDGRIKGYEDYCDIAYIYQMLDGIAASDTIEELFDEFIIGEPFNKSFEITHNNTIIRGIKESIEKGYYKKAKMKKPIVYGAIWVKGEHEEPILKSVAKMNDKGELELL